MTVTAPASAPTASAAPTVTVTQSPTRHIDGLLDRTLDIGASDLHLAAGTHPWVSFFGETIPMEGMGRVLSGEVLSAILKPMVTAEQWARFGREKRLDFSYATDRSRFRGHFAVAGKQPIAVFRTIPNEVPEFDSLGLPEVVKSLIGLESGLVVFVGVTGSGKSSSMAALIKEVKREFAKKIVTIESPIEYRHVSDKSLIVQREVGDDVDTFALGVEDAMREAPDIIVIGEMRDPATMQAAISAASSGHLVLTTIHASSSADVPTRILDSMPGERLADVRAQLSRTLQAAVYQKLLPVVGGSGRALAAEVLVANDAVRNAIRTNNLESITDQLRNQGSGSIPFEVSLARLFADRKINESVARRAEIRPGSFDQQKGNTWR
ncbi:ATPase, T2SS/T4P/T4SS family [Tersicoccus sp. MR15.9]|uniref:type IV pilus twitching motility protein PilT n=1 Tax=Tersicoccus mangrovi TaxID=3121635 RepID=UPI002FE551E3